jgi:hypothetical protein
MVLFHNTRALLDHHNGPAIVERCDYKNVHESFLFRAGRSGFSGGGASHFAVGDRFLARFVS